MAPKITCSSDLDVCIREAIETPPVSVGHGARRVAEALVGSQLLRDGRLGILIIAASC